MSVETNVAKAGYPSWALVISTYRRPAVLERCVVAALKQTVLPAEIVIVDASPDWDTTRQRLAARVSQLQPQIPFAHVPAEVPILPAQRNQGIALSSADILFMIDDDSLMFPDCAEEILKVYAADSGREIASVGAMDAGNAVFPDQDDFVPPPVEASWTPSRPSLWQRLRWKIASLYDRGELSFIPYDGWPSAPVPASCAHLQVAPARSLNGFRMTFRRAVVQRERFIDWFVGSAPLEDIDATYRVSRHGQVVQCLTARLAHLMHPSSRLNHFALAALWVMNGAILLRLYAGEKPDLARRWRRQAWRSQWLDLLKDVLKGRWSAPSYRGMRYGRSQLDRIASLSLEELRDWYLQLQREVRGDRVPVKRSPPELANQPA